jgi:hypothetical protein
MVDSTARFVRCNGRERHAQLVRGRYRRKVHSGNGARGPQSPRCSVLDFVPECHLSAHIYLAT